MVADADHIAGLKKPRRHLLAGHDTPPGKIAASHSTHGYKTPGCQGRFTHRIS
jgi:hypothetical protein